MMWISLSSTWELWSNEDGRFPGSLEKRSRRKKVVAVQFLMEY